MIFRNSFGFSACNQCPAPSMYFSSAFGKNLSILGKSLFLQTKNHVPSFHIDEMVEFGAQK